MLKIQNFEKIFFKNIDPTRKISKLTEALYRKNLFVSILKLNGEKKINLQREEKCTQIQAN
jgi:hypothetical protein